MAFRNPGIGPPGIGQNHKESESWLEVQPEAEGRMGRKTMASLFLPPSDFLLVSPTELNLLGSPWPEPLGSTLCKDHYLWGLRNGSESPKQMVMEL